MKKSQSNAYIKRTENLVNPDEVSIISLFGSMLGKAPVWLQKPVLEGSSKKNPHMGFVVDPYAFFLCHEITDIERAQSLIPENFKVVPTRIFADCEPRPYVIFGAFNLHTSAFWGSRVEMYIIAEDQNTGLLSWVITDYDTNTLSFDPGQGFVAGTTKSSTVTTTHRGTVLVDMQARESGRRIAAEADLASAVMTPLDQRLWLEGNTSVAYGNELDDGRNTPFGLVFDPGEMKQALRIPLEETEVEELSWHQGLFAPQPSVVACFPYAQHFITSSVPTQTNIKTAEQLVEAVETINAGPPSKGFSSIKIQRGVMGGIAVSTVITWSLVFWVLFHLQQAH